MASAMEDILGGVLGKVIGGKGGSTQTQLIALVLPLVIKMLSDGGLSKILDGMKKQGLTAEADSWVGDGENMKITADQAKAVVGSGEVKRIADAISVPEDDAAELIAQALPKLVDHVSPAGEEPPKGDLDKLLDGVKAGLAKN